MSNYTKISDSSFRINWKTSKFAQKTINKTDPVKHSELTWSIETQNLNNMLSVYLICDGNNSNEWNVTVEANFKIVKNDGTSVSKAFLKQLNCDLKAWGFNFFKSSELSNGYIQNGMITIECVVTIQSIAGNHPERKIDFHCNNPELTDVVLMVEGNPMYVGRQVLSSFSPVFQAMFNSNFKEKNQNVVDLPDEKYQEFEQFLQLLYHGSVEISAFNVGNLLKLADKYNTPVITQQCVSFLRTTTIIKTVDKLRYAETYGLSGAVNTFINDIKTVPEYEEACVDIEQRDKKTMVGLIHRAIGMMRKMVVPSPKTWNN